MIKISADATAVRLIVDNVITLKLKIGNDTYVDFPIYDESFPLVKAGKKFRLTLEEEVENEADGSLLEGTKPAAELTKEVYRAMSDVLAENSKMVKTPYHIIDELRRDVAALGTIKKAINQLEVRNEERLASYPDPEIEAHRKHIQEVIMPEAKKVDGMITGTAGGVDEAANKGHFCDGCKHIGVNPESGPCAVCFEGMMYESNKVVTMENEDTLDEKPSSLVETAKEFVKEMVPAPPLSDPQYTARKRKCGKCANSSTPIVCISCIDYSKFELSRYK